MMGILADLPIVVPIYSSDVYAWSCLALLLFWRRRQLNIFIMIHIVIVLVLFYRGMLLNEAHFADNSSEQNAIDFENIYSTVYYALTPFLFVWFYEWWYIGRRRSELDMRDWGT